MPGTCPTVQLLGMNRGPISSPGGWQMWHRPPEASLDPVASKVFKSYLSILKPEEKNVRYKKSLSKIPPFLLSWHTLMLVYSLVSRGICLYSADVVGSWSGGNIKICPLETREYISISMCRDKRNVVFKKVSSCIQRIFSSGFHVKAQLTCPQKVPKVARLI